MLTYIHYNLQSYFIIQTDRKKIDKHSADLYDSHWLGFGHFPAPQTCANFPWQLPGPEIRLSQSGNCSIL